MTTHNVEILHSICLRELKNILQMITSLFPGTEKYYPFQCQWQCVICAFTILSRYLQYFTVKTIRIYFSLKIHNICPRLKFLKFNSCISFLAMEFLKTFFSAPYNFQIILAIIHCMFIPYNETVLSLTVKGLISISCNGIKIWRS